MDIRWLICMFWVLLHKQINATVSIPLESSLPSVPSAQLSHTDQLATTSYLHGTVKEKVRTTPQITDQETRTQSLFATQKMTEFSTLQVTSAIAMKTKLSTIYMSTPSVHRMTSTTRITTTTTRITFTRSFNSTYVPVINDTESNSNGIPLIILVPSAAGGGALLILIVLLCCCCHRMYKRRKNARIFQKYYRPTMPVNLENYLEADLKDSQIKLTLQNKEEHFIESKQSEGVSNEAFSTSHFLPEINMNPKANSDQSAESQNDTEHSTSHNNVQDIPSSEVTNDCGPSSLNAEETIAMETISSLASVGESSPSDDQRASLLILQNLDDVLDNECADDEKKHEKETTDNVTNLKVNQDDAGDGEYFVVIYPFESSNADELYLDVGTTVSVISGKPSAWSWVENKDGVTGWFPTRYLVQIDSDETSEGSQDLHSSSETDYSIPDKRRLPFAVLQSFSGSNPDQISLAQYDIVSVIQNSSTGWSWVYEPDAGSGWFPTNYLEPLVFSKKESTGQKSSSNSGSDYLDVIDEGTQYVYATSEEIQKVKKEGHYQEYEAKAYRASHAYTRSNEDELTFEENETILVLQETDTGWWRGSTYLGEGWFPATFVEDPLINEDNTITEDVTNVNANPTSRNTTDDSYEFVNPGRLKDGRNYSKSVSPYKVTEIVPQRNQSKQKNERETVHQVPKPISMQAAKDHRSRGKGRTIKPCRPAPSPPSVTRSTVSPLPPSVIRSTVSPPPPSGSRSTVSPPPPSGSRSTASPLPPSVIRSTVSPTSPSGLRSTVSPPPSSGSHSTVSPSSSTVLHSTVSPPPPARSLSTAVQVPNISQEFQITPLTTNFSNVETRPFAETLQADSASSMTCSKPSSIAQTSQDTSTHIQENEMVNESENVEGVVIVRPQEQSSDAKSKLIKVTKRRSVINPNICEPPPSRPVPIPPPRKARDQTSKSVDNHQRTRPTKRPRNIGNKKTDIRDIGNSPKHGPERPPPPLPQNINEFRQKRLSSCKESSTKQNMNKENMLSKQAHNEKNISPEESGTEQNDGTISDVKSAALTCSQPISKQQNSKSGNDDEVQTPGNKTKGTVSADTGKVSPKPKPRRRSRDNPQESPMSITEAESLFNCPPTECEIPENGEKQNIKEDEQEDTLTYQTQTSQPSRKSTSLDTTPDVTARSRSLSQEDSDAHAKSRPEAPKIKPRSKSLATLFSSTSSKEQNSESHASSNSQLSRSQGDIPVMRDTQDHVQFDHNGNFNNLEPAKRAFPTPVRPKPKTRAKAKQDDHEIHT
ncbi:uncharacterized protein LOC114521484 isoform X2 [Dendronephthya gigantea]|uniref:uncharacterized protein LOC114521484 isoform X2 n=1 Tax=Dendronephthya gigantea TaxID=151771 RepID=UPI00106BF7F1|nr:uncharacterized protein LOC114521484 isoform X2 [Dendronephthya gigantea]